MGRKKGDSFMTQPPFEILISLAFAILITGFIIAQSGGINSILKAVCDKIPDLCTGSVSTVDYKIAKQSTNSLTCAINTVLTGKQQCMDVNIVTSLEGHATAAGGITGAQTAAQAQGSASVTCVLKNGYPELEYIAGHSDDVWYVLGSDGQWKWKCPTCGENNYRPISEMNRILNPLKVDSVHIEIRNNMAIFNDQNIKEDEKFAKGLEVFAKVVKDYEKKYGEDDKIIVHHKYGTTSKLIITQTTVYGPIYGTESAEGTKETLEREEIGRILNMGLESASVCKVANFNLPETFAGLTGKAEEFMPAALDPSFLIYYQRFPAGEDADWTDQAPWFRDVGKVMMVSMCLFDVFGPVKSAVTGTGKKMLTSLSEKLGLKADSATAKAAEEVATSAERLAPELAGKVGGEAILKFMEQKNVNTAIVEYLRSKYTGGLYKTADDIFAAETQHLIPLLQSGKMAQGELLELKAAFKNAYEKNVYGSVDLTRMLADKAEPGLMKTLIESKVKNPEALAKFAKYVGIDYGISYYMAVIDSQLGKFIKLYPNSLVLGMPARSGEADVLKSNIIPKPQTIAYPESQSLVQLGKPVVLLKQEFGNKPTPFYLASPCMATLTVESKAISCASYTYDIKSGEASCDAPSDSEYGGWAKAFLGKKLPDCSSLIPNDMGTLNRVKTRITPIIENMYNAGIYGEEVTVKVKEGDSEKELKRIAVPDPVEGGMIFYYDKDSGTIDYIGATINVKNADCTDSGKFTSGVWSVKEMFECAKRGSEAYWPLNGAGDGRSLYFSGGWDQTQRVLATGNVIPSRITTEKGVTGFSCVKRKINEDEIERYMSGAKEFDDSATNLYIVCSSPKVTEKIGSAFSDTDWKIYFDLNGKFYGLYVSKGSPAQAGSHYYFVLFDTNNDKKIDNFGHFYYFRSPTSSEAPMGYENFEYRIFNDADYDGRVDSTTSSNCKIPQVVTISVDKGQLKDANGNNYCYKTKSGTYSVASTVLMFGASAIAKAGPYGTAAGVVVDCGLAAVEIWNPMGIVSSRWPNGQPSRN